MKNAINILTVALVAVVMCFALTATASAQTGFGDLGNLSALSDHSTTVSDVTRSAHSINHGVPKDDPTPPTHLGINHGESLVPYGVNTVGPSPLPVTESVDQAWPPGIYGVNEGSPVPQPPNIDQAWPPGIYGVNAGGPQPEPPTIDQAWPPGIYGVNEAWPPGIYGIDQAWPPGIYGVGELLVTVF